MLRLLQIHPSDNVAVAPSAIVAGTQERGITCEAIPAGQKGSAGVPPAAFGILPKACIHSKDLRQDASEGRQDAGAPPSH